MISRKLSKLDLNRNDNKVRLYTYWCRVAYAQYEKWNLKEHAHSFWELHLCVGGFSILRLGKKEYTLTQNTYIFITPKSNHTFLYTSDDYSEFVWGFGIEDNPELDDVLCNKHINPHVSEADDEMLNSVAMILSNTQKSEFGYYDIIKNEIYHVFVLLVRRAGIKSGCIYNKSQNNEISLIRKYIRENLPGDVSIDDVSIMFGISKTSIENKCKKEYNKTFSQIKRDIRADVIRQLLEETDCTMEEIAYRTGFCDRYSMGKFFKKIEGATPGDYRRGIRK